jgi:hypothetical protein
MGTKKTVILEKNFVPLAAHIRDESAGLRRKRRSLDLRPPAAPSRLPLRPRTRPPGKSIPRLIKSSTHFRPPLPTRAQEIPKLAVHKFGKEVLDNFYCTFEATVLKSILQLL